MPEDPQEEGGGIEVFILLYSSHPLGDSTSTGSDAEP